MGICDENKVLILYVLGIELDKMVDIKLKWNELMCIFYNVIMFIDKEMNVFWILKSFYY